MYPQKVSLRLSIMYYCTIFKGEGQKSVKKYRGFSIQWDVEQSQGSVYVFLLWMCPDNLQNKDKIGGEGTLIKETEGCVSQTWKELPVTRCDTSERNAWRGFSLFFFLSASSVLRYYVSFSLYHFLSWSLLLSSFVPLSPFNHPEETPLYGFLLNFVTRTLQKNLHS